MIMRSLTAFILCFTCLLAWGQFDTATLYPSAPEPQVDTLDLKHLIAQEEDPQREAWQRPDTVVAMLGDLNGLTVMDLGCGSGYFSFRLADAGANVICADADERFLDHVETKRSRMPGGIKERISTRHVSKVDPSLSPGEVDIVIAVNTYHRIDDRADYFAAVHDGIRSGGRLIVIDHHVEEQPLGPPSEMKVAYHTVLEELYQAGFIRSRVDNSTLPYQYIITVWRQ